VLESVLTETVNTGITMGQFLLCTITSVMLGAVLAVVHTYRNQYSRSFILTLVLLPVMVQTVIMLVNGNLGTGHGSVQSGAVQVLARQCKRDWKYIPGHGSGSGRWNGVSGNRYAFDDCVWRNYHPFDIPSGRQGREKGIENYDTGKSGLFRDF